MQKKVIERPDVDPELDGSVLVEVELPSTNLKLQGFDSSDETLKLVSRIQHPKTFLEIYDRKVSGTLAEKLAELVMEINSCAKINDIDLQTALQMLTRKKYMQNVADVISISDF